MCSFLYHHQERECEIEMVSVLVCSAAIRKYHRLDDLNNRNLSFHCSGGWKTKIRVSAGLVSGDTFLPNSSLYPHMAFPLCVHTPGFSFSSYKDTSPIGSEPYPHDLI